MATSLSQVSTSLRRSTLPQSVGERVADDNEDLQPGVRDLTAAALEDSDELADRVEELIQRDDPVTADTERRANTLIICAVPRTSRHEQ